MVSISGIRLSGHCLVNALSPIPAIFSQRCMMNFRTVYQSSCFFGRKYFAESYRFGILFRMDNPALTGMGFQPVFLKSASRFHGKRNPEFGIRGGFSCFLRFSADSMPSPTDLCRTPDTVFLFTEKVSAILSVRPVRTFGVSFQKDMCMFYFICGSFSFCDYPVQIFMFFLTQMHNIFFILFLLSDYIFGRTDIISYS
ncbi:MAG TPA: hypothetical protein DCQ37_14135 [Desulfobacteraceae bacterium]|nr:hypothetical protein [Desulfobacteraceae bacterium]